MVSDYLKPKKRHLDVRQLGGQRQNAERKRMCGNDGELLGDEFESCEDDERHPTVAFG